MPISFSKCEFEHKLYVKSPLIYSKPLSDQISAEVYLKLENTQPSGSFKLRGMSKFCQKKCREGVKKFVTFSCGNAGLALAYTCYMLKVECHIFIPKFASQLIINTIKSYGAQISVYPGAGEASEAARQSVINSQNSNEIAYVSSYDDKEHWEGSMEMIEEISEQLNGRKPSCIVASVGGGGMLIGILKAIEKLDWSDIPVIGVETYGAESFHKSLKAGQPIYNNLTSIAKSLGAPLICKELLQISKNFNVISEVIEDSSAAEACIQFARAHRFLVESACGVTLSTVYTKRLVTILKENGFENSISQGPVVLIVCGGSDASIELFKEYAEKFKICEN